MKYKVILVASKKMDSNKKPGRQEEGLIRLPAKTRESLALEDEVLTVWKSKDKKPLHLKPFRAFSEDIKAVKASGNYSEKDLKKIAFVTTETFNKIIGDNAKGIDNIWLSNDIESTVLGADPEFLLFDKDGNVVRANAEGTLSYYGPMGYDGAMAEIRPKPSDDPSILVNNMREIFADKKYQKVLDKYLCRCACYHKDNRRDYPVGGHIHVGNPRQILDIDLKTRMFLFRVLNKIMDELLAIPLIKLDGTEGAIRRTKCQMAPKNGYGYFGEYRCDSGQGNNKRLENRTLSGMWLLNPSVAKAVFGCAKIIVDEVYSKVYDKKLDRNYFSSSELRAAGDNVWNDKFNGWKDIPLCNDMKCTKGSARMIKILSESSPNIVTKSMMSKWKNIMKSFSGYKKYRDYVEAFHDIALLSRKEITGWTKNIKTNWVEKKKFIVDI